MRLTEYGDKKDGYLKQWGIRFLYGYRMIGAFCNVYSERQKFLFLAFTAPILRCVKRSIYLCKIVRIPRSKRQIILSFTISGRLRDVVYRGGRQRALHPGH